MKKKSVVKREVLRSCLWRRKTGTGLEWFSLYREADRFVLSGTILATGDGGPCEARYEVVCDAEWRTGRVSVRVRHATGERRLRLAVRRGRWYLNGREEAAVRGCVDVDLAWTPSTNTLPIRRLGLPVGGGSGPLEAAWIRFPELTLEPLPQTYERTSERRYRYTSRGGAFTAALEVDDDGVVVDYEGLWER